MAQFRGGRRVIVITAIAFAVGACGGGGQSSSQAIAQITTTWQTFFSPSGNPNQVQGMDAQLRADEQKSKLPPGLEARVRSVVLQSNSSCSSNGVPAPCAKVTYDLVTTTSTTPLLANAQGYATRSGGKWLVSKNTFCGLEALGSGGVAPPGC